jgi:hypothetical protein
MTEEPIEGELAVKDKDGSPMHGANPRFNKEKGSVEI